MAVTITSVSLRMLTSQLRNHTDEHPSATLFTSNPFNNNHVYAIHSLLTNTFGCLIPLPSTLSVNQGAIYWYSSNQTNNMKLLRAITQAAVINKLFIVHNDGTSYVPSSESSFTSASVAGGIYIHLKRNDSRYWQVAITDELGQIWNTAAQQFNVTGGFSADIFLFTYFSNSATAVLPLSTPATGDTWIPGLEASDVYTGAPNSSVILPLELVSTAASITANKTTTSSSHVISINLEHKAYITADTHELVFPLPFRVLLTHLVESGQVNYLPVKTGSSAVSTGSFPPIMVKITPVTQADKDYIDAIAVNYTSIAIGLSKDKLSVANGFSSTIPSIVMDLVAAGYIGFFSSSVEGIDTYYGRAAYLIDPAEQSFPIMASRVVKLPYARSELPIASVSSPPGFETYFTGGASSSATTSASEYVFPVKNQFGWSTVQKLADLEDTSVNSYRLTFYPSSPLSAAALQSTTASMTLKVGMYACGPENLTTSYRSPGYAPDLYMREWVQFYYVEVSKINNTISVVKHVPSTSAPPFLSSTESATNASGQLIDWSGSTQVDMIVTKLTPTTGTLTVYLNRYEAASFTVPWITTGHLLWFASNSGSYTSSIPMFTLSTPLESINQVVPYNGLLVPPPPTIHEFVEITTALVTQVPSTGTVDPFVVYIHNKGNSVDVYFPLLQAPDTYVPYKFAIIRNFPYTSGVVYDLLTHNQWYNGEQYHSFIIDTTDSLQFPSPTVYPNLGILFSHLPPSGPTFQVTLYGGTNWGNSFGTYTAEVVTSVTTYVTDPYPRLGGDSLERADTAYVLPYSPLARSENEVLMVPNSLVSMAFSATSDSVWTFTFTRSSVGTYVDGYFDVIMSPVRRGHLFDYNQTDATVNLQPMPHKDTLRIRFTNDTDVYPTVQLNKPIEFAYQPQFPLTTGNLFSHLEGTRLIQITLEKVGASSMLYLHEEGTFIASCPIPMNWFHSGSITLVHHNEAESTEQISHMQLVSGKPWLELVDTRPLLMTPVVNRASQLSTEANVDTILFALEQDVRYGYADIYIRNPSLSTLTVSITIGGVEPMFLANKKVVPAGATLVLRSKHIAPGDNITVNTSVKAFARAVAVCELI